MSDKQISRFPVPELKELPADIRDRILAVQEKTGFVPNVFLRISLERLAYVPYSGITSWNYLTKEAAVYVRCRAKKASRSSPKSA